MALFLEIIMIAPVCTSSRDHLPGVKKTKKQKKTYVIWKSATPADYSVHCVLSVEAPGTELGYSSNTKGGCCNEAAISRIPQGMLYMSLQFHNNYDHWNLKCTGEQVCCWCVFSFSIKSTSERLPHPSYGPGSPNGHMPQML